MNRYRRLLIIPVGIRLQLEVRALAHKLGMSRDEVARKALQYFVERADSDAWARPPVADPVPRSVRKVVAAPADQKVWETEWN